jgi:hypothetical protein
MMDNEARKAAFAEAKARSCETLQRTANVKVERRSHHDDDALLSWRRGMPKPTPALSADDVERKIRDALPGIATVLHEVRQQLRQQFGHDLATLRKALHKAIDGDRAISRHEHHALRADHDRRLASQSAQIERLQTDIAALTLRLDGLTHEREGKVIEVPNFISRRHG